MKYFLLAFLVLNLFTFCLFFVDKRKAIKHKWRIPEATLMLFSALGGCIGGILAMKTFRHKTQKPLFKFGMPLILILQIIAFVFLIKGYLL